MAQTYREAIGCELWREKVFAGTLVPQVLGQPPQWLTNLIEANRLFGIGREEAATALREQAFDDADHAMLDVRRLCVHAPSPS